MFWYDVLESAMLTQLAVNTIGPLGLFDKVREKWAHDSALGMFHCAWCMSFWSAAIISGWNSGWSVHGSLEWLAVAFASGAIVWAIGLVQDTLNELVQHWRRS